MRKSFRVAGCFVFVGSSECHVSLDSGQVWAVYGDADDSVPVEGSRRMIEAIRAAGGSPNYTELKGVGHESWTQTYRDPRGVLKWMFEQRNPRAKTLSL